MNKLKNSKSLIPDTMPRETIVGRIIIEKSTKILIMLVLLMNLAVLVLVSGNYRTNLSICDDDLNLLTYLYSEKDAFTSEYSDMISYMIFNKSETTPVVAYSIPEFGAREDTKERWDEEIIDCRIDIPDNADPSVQQRFNIVLLNSKYAQYDALSNIFRMIFFILCLFLGSCMFSVDANRIILGPMENLMILVNMISKSPEISEELISLQMQKGKVEMNEMRLVEYAILKLGTLLVLVFGQAGNNVIYSNISNIHAENIDVETVGIKSTAIFGFCDIRNFTDLTEILEEDIMVFVNTVAKLVHSTAVRFMGSANKNIGDAFLLVWPLPEECRINSEASGSPEETKTNIFLERYAECALAATVDIIMQLSVASDVQAFAKRPKVIRQMPGFEVKLGFGLHYGWAIEGAIGSEYKIDASYLSPHVNMASRLEAATKQFGVSLLVSNSLHDLLSAKSQSYLRLIDRVKVKGSEEPIGLYTVDLDFSRLKKPPENFPNLEKIKEQVRSGARWKAADMRKRYLREDMKFSLDQLAPAIEIAHVKEDKFDMSFSKGVKYYLDGNWGQAQILIENCLKLRKRDGPSSSLWEFMKSLDFVCPGDWKGARALIEK